MSKVWITVDVDLWKHPKMAALPSDSARWGWLVALSEAKQQRKPGTFAGAAHFKEVVGRYGRWLPDYIRHRLMDEAGGVLVIHDWKKHQWSVTKTRQREDKQGTTEGQKEDASRAVSVPVYVSVDSDVENGTLRARRSASERTALVVACPECGADAGSPCQGVRALRNGETWERYAVHRPRWEASSAGLIPEDPEPEFPLLQWLAKHHCDVRPGDGIHRKLIVWVDKLGADRMLATFEKLSRGGVLDGDTGGFVFGAIDALKPRADLKALEAEDDAELARKRRAHAQEKADANLAYLRGDYPSYADALEALRKKQPA